MPQSYEGLFAVNGSLVTNLLKSTMRRYGPVNHDIQTWEWGLHIVTDLSDSEISSFILGLGPLINYFKRSCKNWYIKFLVD